MKVSLSIALILTTFLLLSPRQASAKQVQKLSAIPISRAPNSQHLRSTAFDGENFFVVWEDRREDESPYTNAEIYGARITSTGRLLDTEGIKISTNPEDDSAPTVTFNGDNFLVVWSSNENDILTRRISRKGQFLDKAPIKITTTEEPKKMPVISFNGTGYQVAWTDYRARQRMFYKAGIYGVRLAKDGSLVSKKEEMLYSSPTDNNSPAIAWNQQEYLLVWVRTVISSKKRISREIRAGRIKADGTKIDKDGFFVAEVTNDTVPRVVAGDDGFLIVWSDSTTKDDHDIFAIRVGQNGTVLDKKPVVIDDTSADQFAPYPVFDGKDYIITWSDYRNNFDNPEIFTTRLSQYSHLGSSSILVSNIVMPITPIVIYSAKLKKLMVGWTDYNADKGNFSNADIWGMFIDDPAGK